MTDTRSKTEEEMIREAMELFGVDRAMATFMVRQGLGELDGDIVGLTREERQALGLDQPLEAGQSQDD